jgi:DNA-binding NarL/FixJ family response regulator
LHWSERCRDVPAAPLKSKDARGETVHDAVRLGRVEKTIKFHRSAIMKKLGVRTVADLVRMAERAGISK